MKMRARRRLLSLGLTAAFAAVAGTAWAVTQADDPDPVGPVPTTAMLEQGETPSGETYTMSRIDPGQLGKDPTEAFCIEIRTSASMTQGCHPVPDGDGEIDGEPLRPSMALLGTDRFFMTIAPNGVTAMEVSIEGGAEETATRSFDARPAGRFLVALVGGPVVTSRDPASSRDYEVRLLDDDGRVVRVIAMSDPGE